MISIIAAFVIGAICGVGGLIGLLWMLTRGAKT